MGWKIIAAIILVLVGFNLLAFSYMKRRIAAAKAEGYRRLAEEERQGQGDAPEAGGETGGD